MPSHALSMWRSEAARALDEVEAAHAAVGGTQRGRRHTTQQLNYAYTLLLSSQFQRYCRDLHSEAVLVMFGQVAGPLGLLVRQRFVSNRKLDAGNPNPGNIGSDFGALFAVRFWDHVDALSASHEGRRKLLEELNVWRNAIAHHDFTHTTTTRLPLNTVKRWRKALDQLAVAFDEVVARLVLAIVGHRPWAPHERRRRST